METMKKLTSEQLAKLKEPLPKEAVKPHPTKNYLSSIKAIYVVERLNEVFGLGGWLISNEVVETLERNVVVKSSFHAPEYGIVVSDIFGGNDNPDRGDAYKGACTDALTKIGSYLYIGMDVYKGLNDNGNTNGQAKASQPTNGQMPPNTKADSGDTRPWLSEKQYNDAKTRINQGEFDLLPKLAESFRMKREFREQLEQATKFSNNLA